MHTYYTFIHLYIHTCIHTYRETFRQTYRQSDRQTDRQTETPRHVCTYRHAQIHTQKKCAGPCWSPSSRKATAAVAKGYEGAVSTLKK